MIFILMMEMKFSKINLLEKIRSSLISLHPYYTSKGLSLF